ncbi:NADH-quinone oxidoreductase subunit K [Phycisphaerae bacterium RAS1]|nr:NADH-quinone oxidoreductase subunit K [Phycisphaerae bacterium RAS1]
MLIPYLLIGGLLFVLGMIGFVTRRNLIIIFLCTELMFQGIVVNLVALDRFPLSAAAATVARSDGQVFSLFLLAVAASEAALALALVVLLFRNKPTLDAGAWKLLRD